MTMMTRVFKRESLWARDPSKGSVIQGIEQEVAPSWCEELLARVPSLIDLDAHLHGAHLPPVPLSAEELQLEHVQLLKELRP